MDRVTITIDEELLEAIDALVVRKGYASRSEAVRDLVRTVAAGPGHDRFLAPEIEGVVALVASGAVRGAVATDLV